MKKVLRTILLIFMETVLIPIKLVLTLYVLVRYIYWYATGRINFKEMWTAELEGFKDAIEFNKNFINTGKFI